MVTVAVLALVACGALGNVHGSSRQQLIAGLGGLTFVISALIAVRAIAGQASLVIGSRIGPSHAGAMRWLVAVFGYLIVLVTTLSIFDVPIRNLLLGGAITGVIVGIAAQQSLGNIFAGVVLLLARPFRVGDAIQIRSGSLGGPIEGTVAGIGMTYVTLITEGRPLSVPNASLLAAAVGPRPTPKPEQHHEQATTLVSSAIDP